MPNSFYNNPDVAWQGGSQTFDENRSRFSPISGQQMRGFGGYQGPMTGYKNYDVQGASNYYRQQEQYAQRQPRYQQQNPYAMQPGMMYQGGSADFDESTGQYRSGRGQAGNPQARGTRRLADYDGDGIPDINDTTIDGPGAPDPVGGPGPGGGGGIVAPMDISGEFPGAQGVYFNPITYKNIKDPDKINYTPIGYDPISGADYNPIDPMEFARSYAPGVRDQMRENYAFGKELALDNLNTELEGLRSFVPAASALKRETIAQDNLFNQYERDAQIDETMPWVRGQLERQAARANTFSEGRVPGSIEDRALELGIRSEAADMSSAGGFGQRSSVSKKASDLMSVRERIGLSQYGDQLLTQNIGTKANLLLAPTQYSAAGQQVSVMPEVGAGRQASQFYGEANAQTLIPTLAGYQASIQQGQFGASLQQRTQEFNSANQVAVDQFNAGNQLGTDQFNSQAKQQNRQFNASNRLNTAQFNSANQLNADMFTAQAQNQFGLAKFQYAAALAGAVAGAQNANTVMQAEMGQQAQAQSIFQDALGQAQGAGTAGAIAGAVGTAITSAPAIIGAVSDAASALGDFFGLSSSPTSAPSGGQISGAEPGAIDVGGGFSIGPSGVAPTGGFNQTSMGDQSYYSPRNGGASPPPSNNYPPSSSVYPSMGAVPNGYTPVSDINAAYNGGQGGVVAIPNGSVDAQLASFSAETGLDLRRTVQVGAQEDITKEFLKSSGVIGTDSKETDFFKAQTVTSGSGVMNVAGVYGSPAPNRSYVGYSKDGNELYSNTTLASSDNTQAGSTYLNTLGKVLDPFGAFTSEDKGNWDKFSKLSGDAAILSTLTSQYLSKDTKGFMNTVLGAYGQPMVESLVEDPQNRAGIQSAFAAFNMFNNWDRMSGAQKSLSLAGFGMKAYKFGTGEDLASKMLIEPTGPNGRGLSVGSALNLMSAGYNAYQLVDKWDQLNTVQKIALGSGTAADIANTMKAFGMEGAGAAGAAVPGVTAQSLAAAGWSSVPSAGIGAITAPVGASLPAGYTAVQSGAEGVIAIPNANIASSAATQSGSLAALNTAAGIVGIGYGAYTLYEGWGMGGSKGRTNGAVGGSAMAAGLYALGVTNPALLAGVVAASVLSGSIKTGKHVDQKGRDQVRSSWQSMGIANDKYQVSLKDGTLVDIGVDGGGGKHTVTDPTRLSSNQKDIRELSSYDVDYTNDLDYSAHMGTVALQRIMFGGKSKATDQMAGQLANASISQIGFNKEMTAQNFYEMQQNVRGFYTKSGIQSKADAYSLANQAFAEGRINETDHVQALQAFDMVFDDNGFDKAKRLMQGRDKGAEVLDGEQTSKNPNSKDDPENLPVQRPTGKLPQGGGVFPVGSGSSGSGYTSSLVNPNPSGVQGDIVPTKRPTSVSSKTGEIMDMPKIRDAGRLFPGKDIRGTAGDQQRMRLTREEVIEMNKQRFGRRAA